jgi:molybdenum cofactor guanylyltransferase
LIERNARVSIPATLGVILAGGLATRMAGQDKARIRIGTTSILERVMARLAPQCSRLIVNGEAARFADTGLTVVADSVPDHAGPLAGILAALDWAVTYVPKIEWVVSAPCDCPFLPRDLVARLHQARMVGGTPLACASSAHRRHPLAALWPVGLRENLRVAVVNEGVGKVETWTARHGAAIAEWPTTPVDPFFNVNTPADAAEADRLSAVFPGI